MLHELSDSLWESLGRASLHPSMDLPHPSIPAKWLMNHDHCPCLGIELRSPGTAHHLQHVGDGEVHLDPVTATVTEGAGTDEAWLWLKNGARTWT